MSSGGASSSTAGPGEEEGVTCGSWPPSLLPWEVESLNSLSLSTKNSELLLPWRWLLGWRGWLLAKTGVGAPAWPACTGAVGKAVGIARPARGHDAGGHDALSQGYWAGIPLALQFHRRARYGEGNYPPGALHLSKQPGAMGEIRSLRPEELCGSRVDGLRDMLQGRGRRP